MMKKTLFLLAAVTAMPVVVSAQDEPAISEECVVNVSLFNEAVKNKQYADAWEPWLETYTNCPNANKAIYTRGEQILDYMYKNAKTDQERDYYRQLAVNMYDKRIKYFGDDPKYPTAYILGEKGVAYCKYYPDSATNAYNWLKQSVESRGQASKIDVLVKLFNVSALKYKADSTFAEQFITDYSLVSGYLGQIADNPLNKNAAAAGSNLDQVNATFAASGAADCAKLDELYATTVEKNQNNLEVLGKIVRLYKRVGCTESEVYFSAAAASHMLQPTEESAVGCAKMCLKRGDFHKAIDYYQEAYHIDVEANDSDEDQSEYLFSIAYIYMDKLHNYPEARTFARRSMETLSANAPAKLRSRALILIGMCYAASKPYSVELYAGKAAILNKTVFWVAVDKFQEAKKIDPACAEDANKLIQSYSRYYPTKEERFDLPNEFSGDTFTVGGWINEKTFIR